MTDDILQQLATTIRRRRDETAERSYTRQLLDAGPARCAKKLGEEAVEVVIAALSEDDAALRGEAADVIYHLLVLLESRNLAIADVLSVLEDRMGTSGLVEKASRKPAAPQTVTHQTVAPQTVAPQSSAPHSPSQKSP